MFKCGIKNNMPDSTKVGFVFLSAVGTTTNVLFVSKCIDLTGILGKSASFAPSWPILPAFRDVVSIQVDFLGNLGQSKSNGNLHVKFV